MAVIPLFRLSRTVRALGSLLIAGIAVWLAGLAWFVASGLLAARDEARPTDAIVVLTGGRQRLDAGLALLAASRGKVLFISGVNPRVDRAMLLRALGPAAAREACCIVLGHQSEDTFTNARETAAWMRRTGYNSLCLVTSWYHMPRALLEFRRAMPQLTIVPHPVFAPRVDPDGWWGRHGAILLVLGEYEKYLAARLRPELAVAPRPEAPSAPAIRAAAQGGDSADGGGR